MSLSLKFKLRTVILKTCTFLCERQYIKWYIFRASPAVSLCFCIVWTVNSNIYLLHTYFFKYIFQQILYLFSISFKYYFFIHYLFIFWHTYPHTPIPTPFFANFLFCFILLLKNSSTSSLENDCSLAKNFLSFKEAVEGLFYG